MAFRAALILLVTAPLLAAGCNSTRRAPPAPLPAAAPAAQRPVARTYGLPLAPAEAVTIASMVARPDEWKGRAATVEGLVRKACTRKGCWMEVADGGDKGAPSCRVTFKDYGFFVPTDSAGSRARVQGTVEVDTLSASAVRHYEEEGATFAGKRPDGTAPELRIVATGVVLTR